MAGNAKHLLPMWERLGKRFDLDPQTPLHNTVYLGNQQVNISLPEKVVQDRSMEMSSILNKHSPLSSKSPKEAEGNLCDGSSSPSQTPVRGVHASSKSSKA